MRTIALCILLLVPTLWAAENTRSATAPSASPANKKVEKKGSEGSDQSPLNKFMGESNSNEPTTTEIFSDEAFFDSNKSMGIFSGHVKVTDPRFNLQSDKLTVYISKGENQGLERAVAEGNVGVVRDRPDPNGGPPSRAVGRADIANYLASTGDVELKGTPRVQQGENTHIATSPETVMIINQKGQLTTHGPSRTDIRQQPKGDDAEADGKGGGKGKKEGKADDKAHLKTEKSAGSPTP